MSADVEKRFDRLRFAVSKPGGPCSASWSIWAHRSNVYVASKPTGRALKLSLHGDERDGEPSRVCQFGHIKPYYDTHIAPLPDAGDRAFHRWKRKPTPDRGVAHVVSIQIATDYLTGSPVTGTPRRPVVLIPPGDKAGQVVEIGLFYSRMSAEDTERWLARTSTPIAYFNLPNGDRVSVADRITKFDPPRTPSGVLIAGTVPLHVRTRHWSEEHKELMIERSQRKPLGMVTFSAPPDGGTLRILELGGVRLSRTEQTQQPPIP